MNIVLPVPDADPVVKDKAEHPRAGRGATDHARGEQLPCVRVFMCSGVQVLRNVAMWKSRLLRDKSCKYANVHRWKCVNPSSVGTCREKEIQEL